MAIKRTLELKIDKVEPKGWDYLLTPQNAKQAPVLVDSRYAKDFAPQPGGTYIRFADGTEGYAQPGSAELAPARVEATATPAAAPEPEPAAEPQPTE